jgi:hypothetical protein
VRATAILAVTALGLTGCSALLGGSFEGEMPESTQIASFSKGSATIAIAGGETILLDQVVDGAAIDSVFGSNVRWTSTSGWHLTVSGAGADEEYGGGDAAYLSFDLIADGRHLTTSFESSTRCIVDVDEADENEIGGSATCKGVKWYDAIGMFDMPPGAPEPLDEPEFDAEVTFEATP